MTTCFCNSGLRWLWTCRPKTMRMDDNRGNRRARVRKRFMQSEQALAPVEFHSVVVWVSSACTITSCQAHRTLTETRKYGVFSLPRTNTVLSLNHGSSPLSGSPCRPICYVRYHTPAIDRVPASLVKSCSTATAAPQVGNSPINRIESHGQLISR